MVLRCENCGAVIGKVGPGKNVVYSGFCEVCHDWKEYQKSQEANKGSILSKILEDEE